MFYLRKPRSSRCDGLSPWFNVFAVYTANKKKTWEFSVPNEFLPNYDIFLRNDAWVTHCPLSRKACAMNRSGLLGDCLSM